MQQEIDALKRDLDALRAEHAALTEHSGQQKASLEDMEAQRADLQRQLDGAETELGATAAELKDANDENFALAERVRAVASGQSTEPAADLSPTCTHAPIPRAQQGLAALGAPASCVVSGETCVPAGARDRRGDSPLR